MPDSPQQPQPIAIIGVSALFPGSSDATGFWSDILAGRDLLSDVPSSHWLIEDYYDPDPAAPDKTYAKRGGFLTPVDFDALAWGVPPATLPATDTAQLLALIVAQAVLKDAAGAQFDTMDRSRISVILGVTSAQELLFSMVSRLQRPVWVRALRETGLDEAQVEEACARIAAQYAPWQEASFPGLLGNVVAGRIANRLNLGGTNCVTDAACASTFSALSMAVNELLLGQSDLVIAGGVDTLNDIFMYLCFSKTPALSPSGDCRPFSAAADGTMLGEGLGMVALKRLADAERDGDRIYAVLAGIGTSSDGRSKSVYAPVAAGQAQALHRAYQQAGYGPDTVELVEAHGTGTKAGDVAEFEGLRQVYAGADDRRRQWCALGSVKSQIGHTKAAAGAAGLFKAVMALHHKVLPPTIKIDAPNPKLQIEDSPFYLNTKARPWIRGSAHARRAAVSAFGFGGSNFHVTLEEYSGPAPRPLRLNAPSSDLLLLQADSSAGLLAAAQHLYAAEMSLAQLARQSRLNWTSGSSHRLALVASSSEQLRDRLRRVIARIKSQPETEFALPDGCSYGCARGSGKLALLFPGQGSQYLQMGADLAMQFELARAVWDRAADLPLDAELRLHEVMFPRPVFSTAELEAQRQRLTATEWAQPALAAHSQALLALLTGLGVQPDLLAGHSFGELMALHAAGSIDAESTLRLARIRGEAMRDAGTQPGAMTAVAASLPQVQTLLASAAELVIANHNGPRQVVVSGPIAALVQFEKKLQAAAIGFQRLPVAQAFHSSLVAPASSAFAAALQHVPIAAARIPVYANSSAAAYPTDSSQVRAQLANQLAQPVRFVEMIEAIYAAGTRNFVEVGPGQVLTALVSAILGERPHRAIGLDRKGRDGVESLLIGLAQMATAGISMQPATLFADTRPPETTPARAKHAIAISGSNLGKGYPASTQLPAREVQKANDRGVFQAPAREANDRGVFQAPARVVRAIPASIKSAAPRPSPEPPQPLSSPPSQISPAWLAVFQESQQQAAAAHENFQRTMAESHAAYLRLAETALAGLNGLLQQGGAALVQSQPEAPLPSVPFQRESTSMDPRLRGNDERRSDLQSPLPSAPRTRESRHQEESTNLDPRLRGDDERRSEVEGPLPSFPRTRESSFQGEPTPSVPELLLAIVAEKTGYPVEMLNLDMDLEGDLGIDSIKRVEILAAVDERAPWLPKVDRARLGALHTLAQIVSALGIGQPTAGIPDPTAPGLQAARPAPGPPPAQPSGASTALREPESATPSPLVPELLLAIVAEKTGYPVEMLNLDMDLEGDLGIDSIKRVEILAAVDERAPWLPKVDRARFGALHTLAQIVAALGESGVVRAAGTPGALESAVPAQPQSEHANTSGASSALPKPQPEPEPKPAPDQPQPPPALGRFELARVPARATGLALPGLLDAEAMLWIVGEGPLCTALQDELLRRGVLASHAPTLPTDARHCIHLGGPQSALDVESVIALNRSAFALARQLGVQTQAAPGLLVMVHDGAAESQEWASGLPALLKTCALEWPRTALKFIELQTGERSPAELAEVLADELLAGGAEIEVALDAQGGRSTWCSVARPVHPSDPLIGADEVVVVSGGARGVTAACLIEWASRCRASFVLLGRTTLPEEPLICAGHTDETSLQRVLLGNAYENGERLLPSVLAARVQQVLAAREIRATLAALEAAGSRAYYRTVAVEDSVALTRVLADVRENLGPIRAVVHAAGVLADKRIVDKTDAQFNRVFDTKVLGLRALLEATRDDPLKLFCVFSSVSARCGNTGQSDYAMANEVLCKVMAAEQTRRPGLRCKALGWGPWEGGMVNPALRERFSSLGVPMIPLATGARMFADEMADPGVVEVVLGGEPRPQALLVSGAEARIDAMELSIDQHSHGWLAGHAVAGVPIVPVVLVAEWLVRFACGLRPGLSVLAVHDLKVLRGIRLDGFRAGGDRLRLEARPVPDSSDLLLQVLGLPVEEQDAQARLLHYSARLQMGLADQTAPSFESPALILENWDGAPLYEQLLFHRERFELIDRIEGVSDQAMVAQVRGLRDAGWPVQQDWKTDVAALDAALQLAVLFGQRLLGAANLPTSIECLRCWPNSIVSGPITVTLQRRNLGSHSVKTDLQLNDSDGRLLAEVSGLQNHALPQ